MDYVKDEFGNIIGYKGDDLSQQQAKLAGIPQGQAEKPVNNIFIWSIESAGKEHDLYI